MAKCVQSYLGGASKEHCTYMGFQFWGFNLKIESTMYQDIGILGLALIEVASRILLKIDQLPIAIAHTPCSK